LPGFDPSGTRTLLRLLSSELAHAEPPLKLKKLGRAGGLSHWRIHRSTPATGENLASLTVLSWDDVVRQRWAKNGGKLCWQGLGLYGHYLPRWRMIQTVRKRPKASFTFFWPLVFVLSISLAALGSVFAITLIPIVAGLKIALIASALAGWTLFGLQQSEQRRVDWLFRAMHCSYKLTIEEKKSLSKRLDLFADHVSKQIDEFPKSQHIVAGYSTGVYLATKIILRILEQKKGTKLPANLKLLTIGQNPGFLASITPQESFRDELNTLLDSSIPWIDLTSPDDWMSFAEVDLYEVLKRAPGKSLKCVKAPLAEAAGLKGFKDILNHQFVLHFQYFRHAKAFSCLDWLASSHLDG